MVAVLTALLVKSVFDRHNIGRTSFMCLLVLETCASLALNVLTWKDQRSHQARTVYRRCPQAYST